MKAHYCQHKKCTMIITEGVYCPNHQRLIITSNSGWTKERILTLTQLWEGGFTANEIVKRMGGTTRNAVIAKARRLKLSGRPSPIKRLSDA
jgi:GcrA cell cycle regulator